MAEVKFEGIEFLTTTVADFSVSVTSFLNELRSSLPVDKTIYINGRPIVGLHIEMSDSNYSANKDKVATLQLYNGSRCIIIQLLHLDTIPQSLKTFLADPQICFASALVNDDIAMLRRDYGLECVFVLDLSPLGDEVNLKQLYRRFDESELADWASEFDVVNDLKPRNNVSSFDWGVRSLTLEQIKYACTTAYLFYLLASLFVRGNQN